MTNRLTHDQIRPGMKVVIVPLPDQNTLAERQVVTIGDVGAVSMFDVQGFTPPGGEPMEWMLEKEHGSDDRVRVLGAGGYSAYLETV